MTTFRKTAIALAFLCAPAAIARAEEITVTTQDTEVQKNRTEWVRHEEPVYKPGAHLIDLSKLDVNADGILTKHEVGQALFKIFDTDGNDLVDNKEFDNKVIATVVPMKETEQVSWYSGDNETPDKTMVSTSAFLKETQLSRFDAAGDGLSAHDFAAKSFADADIDHDHFVDLKEWQGAYDALINAQNLDKQKFSVNK